MLVYISLYAGTSLRLVSSGDTDFGGSLSGKYFRQFWLFPSNNQNVASAGKRKMRVIYLPLIIAEALHPCIL